MPKHIGTPCHAPGCERYVRCDNDVVRLQMFDNPVIGCVYALVKNPQVISSLSAIRIRAPATRVTLNL